MSLRLSVLAVTGVDAARPIIAEATVGGLKLRSDVAVAVSPNSAEWRNGSGALQFPLKDSDLQAVEVVILAADGKDSRIGTASVPINARYVFLPLSSPILRDAFVLASSQIVSPSLPEGEATVFQLSISLLSVSSSELVRIAGGEDFWVSYMVLNVEVQSETFADARYFKPLTDEFSLRGPLSHIKRYIQDSPALLHLFGSRSGLLGTAVLPLDVSDGQPVQISVEFRGGKLQSSSLLATVVLVEGSDNESVVSSATSSRVSSHGAVDVPAPVITESSSAEARELLETCLKMQEDLQKKLLAVEAHEAALARKEEDFKRKVAGSKEELAIHQRRFEEEMEHKIALEKLKQDALVLKARQTEDDAKAQRARVKRLESEIVSTRDAFADTSVGRLEMENVRLRGEVEDLKDRLAREKRETAMALDFKDKQLVVLAAELESLRLNRQGPLSKQLAASSGSGSGNSSSSGSSFAGAPHSSSSRSQQVSGSTALPPARSTSAQRRRPLHESKHDPARLLASSKPGKRSGAPQPSGQQVVRSVVARARELRNEINPELQALVRDREIVLNSGQYDLNSEVVRTFDRLIADYRARSAPKPPHD